MYSLIRSKGLLAVASCTLIVSSLIGCKDNDDSYNPPSLQLAEQIEGNAFALTSEGEGKQISFTSNRKWTSSFPSWVDVSPSQGEAGTYTISIKALPNSGAERTGSVSFKYGSSSYTIALTQAGSSSPIAPSYQGMPLAEFITKYYKEGEAVDIAEDISFQAVVISDKSVGNTQPKNAHVQAEGAGIVLRFKANHKYDLGAVLNVRAKGAKLQRYNGGILQLELSEDTQAEATGEVRTPQAIKATLKDIYDGKYENMLVELENIQFEKANEPYLRTDKNGKLMSTFHNLSDCSTKPSDSNMTTLSLSISNYAAEFKDKTKSDKRGSIVGIINYGTDKTKTKKYRNLIPRSFADIKLTEERCTDSTTPPTSGGNDKPTTPSTPPPTPPNSSNGRTLASSTSNRLMITAYVSGSSNDKFLQIYNPTEQSIDLSQYKIVMQSYSSKNTLTGAPQEEVLSGSIAPKSVIVYKNEKARSAPEGSKSSPVINFNGNDNIDLRYNDAGTWVVVDALGVWDNPWLNGNKNYAQYTVLKRNTSVMKGNTSYTEAEWTKETTTKDQTFPFLNARP